LYVFSYHTCTATDITGESYEFKRLDLSNEEDKAYFEGAMAWELTVDGKEWADGKNFK
jgi:elongation factor 1-gamma